MTEHFLTICVACTKGVTRDNMQYVNGRVFHPECYQKYGDAFLVVDQDLAKRTRRLKIELVQLKNLKIRKKIRVSNTKSKLKRKSYKKSKKASRKKPKTKSRKIKPRIKKKPRRTTKRVRITKRKNKTRSKRR